MRTCTKCGIPQEDSEFFFKNRAKDILHSNCKTCKRELDNKAYQENRHGRKSKIRSTAKVLQSWSREYIQRVKKRSRCSKCGDKRWYVLDFHHTKGKDNSISTMNCHSIDSIKKELRKCIVLCSNCHREHHYLEKKLTLVEAQD